MRYVNVSAQVFSLWAMGEYRRLVPQGRFKQNNDFSAILKTIVIVALEDYDDVSLIAE